MKERKYVDVPYEMQKSAVMLNGSSIYYIEGPSEDIQLLAISNDFTCYKYINNPSAEATKLYEHKKFMAEMEK